MSVFTTKNIDEQVQTALFRKLAALDRGVYNKDGESISRALSETKDNAIGQQLARLSSVIVIVILNIINLLPLLYLRCLRSLLKLLKLLPKREHTLPQ